MHQDPIANTHASVTNVFFIFSHFFFILTEKHQDNNSSKLTVSWEMYYEGV